MRNLHDLPRVRLGVFPTPFYRLDRLSEQYGRGIWIKRDDLCGVALGGSKVRKLEFVLAEALDQGCDTVFTTGGAQSNHAALTAACAARLGMKCILLLKRRGVTEHRGNLVLDEVYGASVHFFDTDDYADIYEAMNERSIELAEEGHRAYPIPVGGSTTLGTLGYVGCVREIAQQAKAAGMRPAHLVSATGSGGTTAGLLLGASLELPETKVTGIGVDDDPFEDIVPELAAGAAELLGWDLPRRDGDFEMVYHVGPGYAIPNPEDTPYIQELARTEGNVLLTTGAKELGAFSPIAPERCYPRVLPTQEGIAACEAAGVPHRNIIAMQGPFSRALNEALIQQFEIRWLVTKDGGAAGGFAEKAQAAAQCGVQLIVLRRPEEQGETAETILQRCRELL